MNKEDFTLTLQHWGLEDMQPGLFLTVTGMPLLKAKVATKIDRISKNYIYHIYIQIFIAPQ